MPNYRVLIVDDQRDIRRVLRAALETLDKRIQVTDVPSGEEAILVISRQPVDLLISDVRLPGISGLELIERARVRNPGLYLLLITGMTDEKVRRQVELAQADAFFYKPISIDVFLDCVSQLLDLDGKSEPLPTAPPLAAAPAESPARLAPLQPDDTRLVFSARRPEPPAEPPPPKSTLQLVQERVVVLRKQLDAVLTAVITVSGDPIAADGRPTGAISEWPAAVEAAAAFAASPAARLRGLELIPGMDHDFLVASVTERVVLLAGAVHPAWQTTAFGRLADALWSAAGDLRAAGIALLAAHDEAPAAAAVPAPDLPGAPEEGTGPLPDLGQFFELAGQKKLDGADVDAFWDLAAEDHSSRQSRPGAISFDQARQLGLAPDED